MTPPLALVVGGSRGLGLLIARELHHQGYRVVISARNQEELARAADDLATTGEVHHRVCDVREEHQVNSLIEDVESSIGPIEVVLTVAGIIQVGPAESMTLEHFREAIDTMTWGPIYVAWATLPYLRRRGRGRIGTIASVGGMVSAPHLLPYATAKFGAVGFSDGLAASLSGTGITATTVVPGLMRTGSHERARFCGDAAKEYAWFAAAASLPIVSINAERAAQRIVRGVLDGAPMVTFTPLAQVGIRVRGLMPATTTRVMGLAHRLLPQPDGPARPTSTEGRRAAEQLGSRAIDLLTTLGSRAAQRNNERPPSTP